MCVYPAYESEGRAFSIRIPRVVMDGMEWNEIRIFSLKRNYFLVLEGLYGQSAICTCAKDLLGRKDRTEKGEEKKEKETNESQKGGCPIEVVMGGRGCN